MSSSGLISCGRQAYSTERKEPASLAKRLSRPASSRLLNSNAVYVCFGLWLLYTAGNSLWKRPQKTNVAVACDPFAQPGTLFLDLDEAANTTWKPFDSQCPQSHLTPLVQMVLESDVIHSHQVLPWLVNKTVVFIGDSIERFSVDYFCDVMEGDLSLIDLNHPWSPPPFTNGRDELLENEEITKTWVADGRPHRCHISDGNLNLNLISFFMYGSADFAEFQLQEKVFARPHYFAPVELGPRLDYWVKGVLERAGLKADIVQFSSQLWDIMHWSEIDSTAALSTDVVHSPFNNLQRLDWYRSRLSSALDKVERAFPSGALVWRRGHDVPCGQFHVPCARNAQFISVANDVIAKRRSRWSVDETGALIRGYTDFYKDKVHPGMSFRGLMSDILLYRLREVYRSL